MTVQGATNQGNPVPAPPVAPLLLKDVKIVSVGLLGFGTSSRVKAGTLKEGNKAPVAIKIRRETNNDSEKASWNQVFKKVRLSCRQLSCALHAAILPRSSRATLGL